jgi:arylformamidase
MPRELIEGEYSPSSMLGGGISGYLAAYAELSAKARRQFACREDLRYGGRETERLDFFPPLQKGSPLFVFVHGGYWQELSHKQSSPMAGEVLEAGFAFASIDYTLAPAAPISLMVEEVGLALAFLRESADELGFTAERITLAGHSAGAHLAAMQIMGEDASMTSPRSR